MESDESQYHAAPQTMGRIAHKTVDEKKTTNGKGDYSLNRKQFKKSDFVLLKSEYGSVVILGGLTFVNFSLCIHLC